MPRPQIIAGIDIGSSKIVTMIASSLPEEEEKIRVLGVASVPSKGIRKGQIVNIEETTGSLLECVEAAERMAGYNLNRALISISGPNIASCNSRGVVAVAEPENEITKEDIKRVIEAAQALSMPASREMIHVIPRYFTADGQEGIKDPVGMSGVRLEVETHIISGSSTAIKNLTRSVAEIGVEAQDLVVSGLAAAESVLTETEKELGVVLVDIGGGVTDIVVYVEGSPFYTTVLPIGAKNVTNDLAIGLRLSLEAAEKIKVALSEKPKKKKDDDEGEEEKKDDDEIELADLGIMEETKSISKKTLIEGIIKPRLNEIFTMVGLEIKKSGATGLTPSGIVLCGGGAQTVGVIESAKRILAMPVRVGIPKGLSGLIDEIEAPEYAVASGLVLYRGREEKASPTLFPLGRISKGFQKIPGKGMANKFIDLIKSFLP